VRPRRVPRKVLANGPLVRANTSGDVGKRTTEKEAESKKKRLKTLATRGWIVPKEGESNKRRKWKFNHSYQIRASGAMIFVEQKL